MGSILEKLAVKAIGMLSTLRKLQEGLHSRRRLLGVKEKAKEATGRASWSL